MYKIRLQRDFFFNLWQMTKVTRGFCWHQNFVPWGCLPLTCGYILSNDDPGLTLTIFMTGSNLFLMLLYGWQLIEHLVLLYSQVYSNSAYPQHSGERYRTNGPLVFYPNRIRTQVAVATYSCHWLIVGKNENWHLLLSADIWQKFYRNFPFVQTSEFDWQPKGWILDKILKNHLLRSHKEDKAETLQKCFIALVSTKIMLFIAIAYALSLLWQLKIFIDI